MKYNAYAKFVIHAETIEDARKKFNIERVQNGFAILEKVDYVAEEEKECCGNSCGCH